MELKEYFAHWFKSAAQLGKVPADKYDSRISAILQIADGLDQAKALEIARLYFGLPARDSNAVSDFKQNFVEQDASFDPHDSEFLFQVLAAITLIQLLNRTGNSVSDAVGLAISTRTLQYQKRILPSESVSADLTVMAENYLKEEARRVRAVAPITKIVVPDKKLTEPGLKDLKTQVDQSPSGALALNVAHPLFAALQKNVSTLDSRSIEVIQKTNDALEAFRSALQASGEETNIVWWLVAGWSSDLDQPYSELTAAQTCLLAAKEVADLTLLQPGPPSAKAFLHRTLKNAQDGPPKREFSIKEIVRSVPQNWSLDFANALKDSGIVDFCPLHFALLINQEAPDGSWGRRFEKHTGTKASTTFPLVELSYQFYRERILVDVVG